MKRGNFFDNFACHSKTTDLNPKILKARIDVEPTTSNTLKCCINKFLLFYVVLKCVNWGKFGQK